MPHHAHFQAGVESQMGSPLRSAAWPWSFVAVLQTSLKQQSRRVSNGSSEFRHRVLVGVSSGSAADVIE